MDKQQGVLASVFSSLLATRYWLLAAVCFVLLLATGYSLPSFAEEQALSDLNLEWLKKKEEAGQWGRDPFALPTRAVEGGESGAEAGLQLSAIIYRAGRGVAIINNRIVRRGDVIEGVQITDILPDRVVLTDASGTRELRVNRFAVNP